MVGSEAIIIFLPALFWVKIALSLLAFFYGLQILLKHGLLLNKKSIVALERYDEDWIVVTRNASDEGAISGILGSSTITTKIAILRFERLGKGKIRECVVFPDAIGNERYRELIVSVRG